MSILNVDKIQPIGSGSTVTVNATDTILTNAQAGVITATSFSGGLPITSGSSWRVVTSSNASTLKGEQNLQFDGTDLYISDGIKHKDDTNTKIRFPADDTFTVTTANVERFRIGSNGYIGVGDFSSKSRTDPLNVDSGIGTCNIGGNYIHLKRYSGGNTQYINAPQNNANLLISADDFLAFGVDHSSSMYSMGTEAIRITSAGLVGISTNAPSSALLDIATSAGSNDHLRLRRLSSDSNVATNWSLKPYAGNLYFREGGSTDKIYFDDNGDIVIMDGNLVIGTAGHGIDFSTQTASSASGVTTNNETLDHFEEGTWTPTQATIGSWASGAEIDGKYQRVGNWVTASFIVKYASNGSGHAASIDGLPFTNNNTGSSYKQGGFVSYATNSNVSSLLIGNGENRIYIYTNTGSTYALTNMDNVEVRGTVIYRVA